MTSPGFIPALSAGEPGTTLWSAGDPANWVSLLVSGEVTCTAPGGLPHHLGPGTPLGSLEATGERPRWYTAVARTQVTALVRQNLLRVQVLGERDPFFQRLDHFLVVQPVGR